MFIKKRFSFIPLVLILSVMGCQSAVEAPDEKTVLGDELQKVVAAAVDNNAMVRSAALYVDAPALGLSWEGAAGSADPEKGLPMTPATPVRIASNTKTFVAASILRLMEEGALSLDDPVAAHLPDEYTSALKKDGYDPEAMTVRHLLTHTSGLFDHSSSPKYEEAIFSNPQRRWTPEDQFEAAMEWGDPHGAPGEIFTYCDTGYILLCVILERISGNPLAEAVRDLLRYDLRGLRATWWETLEPQPAGVPERAHQFIGDIDTAGFDPSFDLYGGGGLVSTVGDMARFFRALFEGAFYNEEDTIDTMLTTVEGARALADAGSSSIAPGAYRMGIWEEELEGFKTYRHSGFFGTCAVYVPDLDLVIACCVNQHNARSALYDIVRQALVLVSEACAEDRVR
ncbi:MAG: serine hydrolase domain-containing protein [Planctomycetota bacterium]